MFCLKSVVDTKWDCSHCQDYKGELPHEDKNKTWGVYEGYQYSKCDECKSKCERDKSCAGVECFPKTGSSLVFRSMVRSCVWRSERLSRECVINNKEVLTCWKNDTGSIY